ncbi:hypothetical protein Golax_017862 [Gossypium laxum]|uniref:Uncharacterized protein n=1 Tax=Gossypium laxum TaxID=34288 RepID=A0A7J8Z1Q2_9ROSI|nr:hypothetical protein [Gossypium laxum]
MEGIRSSTRSRDLLRKIKEFTLSILEDLSEGRSPLIFIKSFRTYCTNLDSICSCRSNKPSGHEILTFQKESHVHRIVEEFYLLVLIFFRCVIEGVIDSSTTSSRKQTCVKERYILHASINIFRSNFVTALKDLLV